MPLRSMEGFNKLHLKVEMQASGVDALPETDKRLKWAFF